MEEPRRSVLNDTDEEAIRLARTLIRTARHGALAVLQPGSGVPLVSRVGMASDLDGAPLILVSGLAAHTGAIEADPRCSLLLGEPGKGDPLAYPRLTLVCRAVPVAAPDGERAARRYLRRNPKASLYAGLGDFRYFRLEPENAALNGGFGKAFALSRHDVLSAVPKGLAEAEPTAIDHMNADHADAVAIYARAFAGGGEGRWLLSGIDGEGLDLMLGDDMKRVWFPVPLAETSLLRQVLVDLARAGRSRLDALP